MGARMKKLLSLAGRHGPVILFVGVLLGLVVPTLADVSKPLMGAAVFVFTLGAFLKVDRPALRSQLLRPPRLALWLVWIVAGVPIATWALLAVLPLSAGTKTGILLCMLAPPVGSAAAMAAMLRLNPALALIVTVIASLFSPIFLPTAALLLGGLHLHLDPLAMTLRIGTVVGGAAIVAAALRRFAGGFVDANPQAMTGVSVIGLIVVAMGAMQGMPVQLDSHLGEVARALAVAFAMNAGFQTLGTAIFARHGADDALTVGLMSGNRNVTLVWVAVLPWLAQMPGAELYLAAAVFPIFMLPLPLSKLLDAWRRRSRARATDTLIATYDDALTPNALRCVGERGHRLVERSAPGERAGGFTAVRGRVPGAEAHRPIPAAPR